MARNEAATRVQTSDLDARLQRRAKWSRLDIRLSPYLYISPFYIVFAIVGLFPLLYTAYIATRKWNSIAGDTGTAICGATCGDANATSWFGNFDWVLHQPDFWVALRNTFAIFLISTVPQIIAAILIAHVLDSNLRAKTFWRMGVLLPYVVAPMAAAIIFSQVFSDNMGIINSLFNAVGLPKVAWHANPLASWIAIASIVDFRWTGYNTLILLAAMQAIPHELNEAAEVDGAGRWRQLVSITIPQLRPTLIFVIITSTIGGLQIFDEPQMFSSAGSYGGSSQQFLTVTQFLWRTGFVSTNNSNMGRAAAVAWILFLIIVAMAVVNFLLTSRISSGDARASRRAQKKGGAR
ncbi:MAG: sugar ABC transporter permease [Propionibacteriaceae bacterium]|nr:sugar ABC transporter permease [Propionibacteriaceae bacterium]